MAFQVEVAPRALADIEAAFLYIRRDSPERASRWLLGIIDAINSLEEMPARCPVAPESEDLGEEVRVLHFGKRQHVYRVFFSIRFEGKDKGVVRVFHVRHGARRKPAGAELGQFIAEGDTGLPA
jgi:plasmid stabilization system protein ParE